ncbi:MAG: hypothetical protein OQK24_07160 [Magnetovibrio sp.]|nr:hypothetical protein [Magnetovibrio sp.]
MQRSPGVRLSALPTLPRVLGAQIGAFAVVAALAWALGVLGEQAEIWLWGLIVLQSLTAAALSYVLYLRGRWLIAQAALVPLAWAALAMDVPAWIYLAVFLALALVYSNVSREQVPLYLTNRTTWAALSEFLTSHQVATDSDEPLLFIDLGSGLGGTLASLARAHPSWNFVGVENAPGPYVFSRLRLLPLGNAKVAYQSLWDADLSRADVIYAFLSPTPMERLIDKTAQDMKPGSVFLSNSFWAQDRPFDGEIEVNDNRQTRIFFKKIL